MLLIPPYRAYAMRPGDAYLNHKSSPKVSYEYDCSRDGSTSSEISSKLRMCCVPSPRPSTGNSASNRPRLPPCARDQRIWSATVRVTIECSRPASLDRTASGGCLPPIKMPGCAGDNRSGAERGNRADLLGERQAEHRTSIWPRLRRRRAFCVCGAYQHPGLSWVRIYALYSREHNWQLNNNKTRHNDECHDLLPRGHCLVIVRSQLLVSLGPGDALVEITPCQQLRITPSTRQRSLTARRH